MSSRRSSSLVAAGIFLSRVAGLAREVAIAGFLGTSGAVEAFRAAMRIPNVLQNLLGEGVLSASFIPVYSRLLAQGREEEAGRVAGAIAGLLLVVTGGLVVLGVVLARPLVDVIAFGLTGETRDLAVTLLRIVTPGVGLLVLSAWCLGVLNSHRRFFLSYVAPVLWNVAQIAALVAAGTVLAGLLTAGTAPERLADLAVVLAWGTVAGGALQLGAQLPTVLRLTTGLRLSLSVRHPGVRQALRAFGPIVLARGGAQLSALVDLALASVLAGTAVAILGYAQVLYLLPISLFGMSVAAAELPELSARSDAAPGEGRERVRAGLARVAFFVAPIAGLFLVAGDLVVGALWQRGQFDAQDALTVGVVLGGYALGLLAITASRLLQSALYAAQAAAVVARASLLRVVLAAALGAALMLQLDRVALTPEGLALVGELPAFTPLPAEAREALQGAGRLGPVGLTLGAAVGAWVEYLLLRRQVAARLGPVRLGGGELARTLGATGVAMALAVALRPLVEGLPPLLAGPAVAAAGAVAYLALGWWLGLTEARALLAAARARRGG